VTAFVAMFLLCNIAEMDVMVLLLVVVLLALLLFCNQTTSSMTVQM